MLAKVLLGLLSLTFIARSEVKMGEEKVYFGMCDASAGFALTEDLFIAADDETNKLRVYSRSRPGAPIHQTDLNIFLRTGRGLPEADIEGSGKVGDVVYWITSHGRNKDGEYRQSRHRLFATRLNTNGQPRLDPIGIPYANLLRDLASAPQLAEFHLDRASRLAPKDKGALNIEGLCARPDGTLLIGFRNPNPRKHALIVPLLNPAELVKTPGARAQFGEPILLDLNENGVRDMLQRDGKYYIIAGGRSAGKEFEFYEWDGASALRLLQHWEIKSFNPEAVLAVPNRPNEFLILSDEGSRKLFGKECKKLPERNRRFRSVLVTLQP